MKKEYDILSTNYGVGNNSIRYLIEDAVGKKIIKITDCKEEFISCEFTPKLFSVNDLNYAQLNTTGALFVYEYEFIDGALLKDCTIDDDMFLALINMLLYFLSNEYFVWDCHIDNIVISDGKPFFVDLGGIAKMPFNQVHYIFDFTRSDCPEEWLSDDYPLSYNNETSTIYWLADQIIKKCHLNLSNNVLTVLNKMHSHDIANRYSTFKSINDALRR